MFVGAIFPASAPAQQAVTTIRGDDGAEMVLVPAGEFWMGNSPAEVARLKEECKKLGATDAQCKDAVERESPRRKVT